MPVSTATGEKVPGSARRLKLAKFVIALYAVDEASRANTSNYPPPSVVATRCALRFSCFSILAIVSMVGFPWIFSRSLYSKNRAR